jgi:pyruvate kinase
MSFLIWLVAKIEDKKGLEFVAREFRKCDELTLVAARGDLFVEVDRPHHILAAQRLILAHDPEAMVGSRILLSLVKSQVPSAADLSELAWLWDIGYRKFMLCDELCLKEELLATAVNVFEAFFRDYPRSLQI